MWLPATPYNNNRYVETLNIGFMSMYVKGTIGSFGMGLFPCTPTSKMINLFRFRSCGQPVVMINKRTTHSSGKLLVFNEFGQICRKAVLWSLDEQSRYSASMTFDVEAGSTRFHNIHFCTFGPYLMKTVQASQRWNSYCMLLVGTPKHCSSE